ncbi:hypothetical protein NC99_44990 [Sunxiuqinia dokdonensis]|uniref:Uncharacterized protein n=1 Tax=Sunxiuqinia dokdonensis TaxID=1409788 RepID=A0A0L8V2T3_9BACT|nr:hypothetical protein NC99_44990 [Sunxiuqinia dokdonensis]
MSGFPCGGNAWFGKGKAEHIRRTVATKSNRPFTVPGNEITLAKI